MAGNGSRGKATLQDALPSGTLETDSWDTSQASLANGGLLPPGASWLLWGQGRACRSPIGSPGLGEGSPKIQWPNRTRAIPRRTRAELRGARGRWWARLRSAWRHASSIRCLAISTAVCSWMSMILIPLYRELSCAMSPREASQPIRAEWLPKTLAPIRDNSPQVADDGPVSPATMG